MSEKSATERLLDNGEDLTLLKAIEIAQQFEPSQKHIKIFREEVSQVQAVKVKTKHQTAKKTVQVAVSTHNISGIKENAQQNALYAHTVINQTTGWQYAAKDQ